MAHDGPNCSNVQEDLALGKEQLASFRDGKRRQNSFFENSIRRNFSTFSFNPVLNFQPFTDADMLKKGGLTKVTSLVVIYQDHLTSNPLF